MALASNNEGNPKGGESPVELVLDTAELIEATIAEIQEVYLADDRPWVIGFSGGKDSSVALQLVWTAVSQLPCERREKPVYVISGDTLVETPAIIEYLQEAIERINSSAAESDLPISAHTVTPDTSETFWVNLIGKGYPAPSSRFRWCTDRMKIKPANKFIMDRVAEHGEVVVVLGVRSQESATRAQVMSLRRIKGSVLSHHSTLPSAYVYTPIRDYSIDNVWEYLLQAPSPWGANNHDLLAMYKNSSADECPLVVDTSTPSCGNSRFGCWTCTVVESDRAMEAMVDNGQEWLVPLLEFRDFLAETHSPKRKAEVRGHVRRNGQVQRKTFGSTEDPFVRGPYRLDFCKELLRRLLEAQARMPSQELTGPSALITLEELAEIRRIWRHERHDWSDSVPEIVRSVLGDELALNWADDDAASFGREEELILASLCHEEDTSVEMMKRLIDTERALQGLKRRSSIMTQLDSVLGQEWRDEQTVAKEIVALEQSGESADLLDQTTE